MNQNLKYIFKGNPGKEPGESRLSRVNIQPFQPGVYLSNIIITNEQGGYCFLKPSQKGTFLSVAVTEFGMHDSQDMHGKVHLYSFQNKKERKAMR